MLLRRVWVRSHGRSVIGERRRGQRAILPELGRRSQVVLAASHDVDQLHEVLRRRARQGGRHGEDAVEELPVMLQELVGRRVLVLRLVGLVQDHVEVDSDTGYLRTTELWRFHVEVTKDRVFGNK